LFSTGVSPNTTFVCEPTSTTCYSMELVPLQFSAAAAACARKSGMLVQHWDGTTQNFGESCFV
jgi:hypothetical protein